MAMHLPTPRAAPAVIPLTTARFGTNATDGGLQTGTDGLLLPIALAVVAVVAVVAGAFLLTMVRRHRQAGPAAEAAESDDAAESTLGSSAARDRNLPRWLDRSVADARFRTDTTTAVRAAAALATSSARLPVVFTGPIDEGIERALVRYDSVPLLDRPDDVLGQTLRELDGGDEVEVLERVEVWARVRTPNGGAGWLSTMTLAAVAAGTTDDDLDADDPDEPGPPAPVDELPGLESILEAIAAQRLARSGPATSIRGETAVSVDAEPTAPKRTRSRKPKSDQPTPQRVARQELASRSDPVPAADLDAAPAAPTRRRPRTPTSERRAAGPR
ncbi:MAG TPA: hypothetical protein VHM48_00765 [Candidatus Limnocylindrales bacterium]|nr:hypothetical protein [Candidatus Limnocylindrales bacterium]